jgi:hypothetical protein
LHYLKASTSTAVGPGLIKEAIKDEGVCLFTGVALNAILVKSHEWMVLEREGIINFYDRIRAETLKKCSLCCSQGGTLNTVNTVNTVPVTPRIHEEGRDVLTGAARCRRVGEIGSDDHRNSSGWLRG